MKIIIIGLGGGVGAVCRYLLGLMIANTKFQQRTSFPLAMILVNLLGSLGLGYFLGWYNQYDKVLDLTGSYLYLLIAIGFFGAFTTFSTFSLETRKLIDTKQLRGAILYLFVTIVGCIVVFFLGFNLSS